MKSEYVRFRKTIGMSALFEKSYKNTRTKTDTIIDTIVSVTASAFFRPFLWEIGRFSNFCNVVSFPLPSNCSFTLSLDH